MITQFRLTKDLPEQTAIRLTIGGTVLPWDGTEKAFSYETGSSDTSLSATLELIPAKGFFAMLIGKIRRVPSFLRALAWLLVPLCALLTVPLSILFVLLHAYGEESGPLFWAKSVCPYRAKWGFSFLPKETVNLAVSSPVYRASTERFAPPCLWVDGELLEGETAFDGALLTQGFKRLMSLYMLGIGTLCLFLEGLFGMLLLSLLRGNLAVQPTEPTGILGLIFLVVLILAFIVLPVFFYRRADSLRQRIILFSRSAEKK